MKKIIKKYLESFVRVFGFCATLPFHFIKPAIEKPSHISHQYWVDFLVQQFNKPGMRILEIGSRNVTGANFRNRFNKATYIGFDYYEGENVDVVGDVHSLTNYFDENNKFDLIFSSAVFEHLHMPWVAAVQIQKLLKVGGYVFIETHFSFSSHERPWHFFQFSDVGLRALFNDALGFDLIDKGMCNPIAGFYGPGSVQYLRYKPVFEMYCHSEILCRKRCEIEGFDWGQVKTDGIVNGTRYPLPINQHS